MKYTLKKSNRIVKLYLDLHNLNSIIINKNPFLLNIKNLEHVRLAYEY